MLRHHRQHIGATPLPRALICQHHGIYMCAKSTLGSQYSVHVGMKTSSSQQEVCCEVTNCQQVAIIAHRTRFGAFQCPHLQAVLHAEKLPATSPLDDSVLDQLVAQKLLRQSTVKVLSAVERDDSTAEMTSFRANEKLLSAPSRKSPQQFQLHQQFQHHHHCMVPAGQ